MVYLLDANVLITAHTLYYGIESVPEFWTWIAHQGDAGNLKMPLENFEEVKDGSTDEERDLLYAWVTEADNKRAILLDEKVDEGLVARVIFQGYAPDLTEDEILQRCRRGVGRN